MVVHTQPCRILLIENHAQVRHRFAELLAVAGHLVTEAETGSTGLALLRTNPTDLILTEGKMPV